MRSLALAAIRAYQRYISPHKGFCCAYGAHTGRPSCSQLGYRAIRRHGLFAGLRLIHRRLYLCGVAHRRFSSPLRRPHRSQRGDCDPGCDLPCNGGIDLPKGKTCLSFGDLLSCCDCGSCDWSNRKNKKSKENTIHIPPRTKFK